MADGQMGREKICAANQGREMIYFIQAADPVNLIKIGWTAGDAEARRRELQTGSPLLLTILASFPGSREDERAIHKRFAAFREQGEWFRPAPKLLLWVFVEVMLWQDKIQEQHYANN